MGVNTSTDQSASETVDMIKLVQTAKSSPGSFTAIFKQIRQKCVAFKNATHLSDLFGIEVD